MEAMYDLYWPAAVSLEAWASTTGERVEDTWGVTV